jgi:segregation and condensation protein A
MGAYTVKQASFEGPLELLLELIEKRKLFINDISLAKVTDDFISRIQAGTQHSIADSAQFILVASTLLLIKSKSLLPTLSLTQEEQGSIEDLNRRLALYQRIKDVSVHIKDRFGTASLFFPSQSRSYDPVFSPDDSMTLENIRRAMADVLLHLPKKESLPKVLVKKVISLEEMIDSLTVRIQTSLRMAFKTFAGVGKEEKVTVIVSFLAMLELVKQGILMVSQEQAFEDIQMESRDIGVPKYVG